MKSWIFAALMVVIVVSCNKSPVSSPVDDDAGGKGRSLLQELLSKDIASQRVMFGMLSPESKKSVWEEHLLRIRSKRSFNEDQLSIIDELRNSNHSSYYQDGSDEQAIGTTLVFNKWIEKAKNYFSENEIYQIAFTINEPSREIDNYARSFVSNGVGKIETEPIGRLLKDEPRSSTNDESLPDCGCRVGSSFTCPYTVTPPNGGLPALLFGECKFQNSSGCDVEGGCGFMGWSLCDGNVCVKSFS